MDILGLTIASGWASGLNAYATVLVLGLLGRFGGVQGIPEGLQRTDVLIVAGVLVAIEFLADKIPYVDTLWDIPSTIIRPLAGATIGALIAGANGDLPTIALAAIGGVTALLTHLSKAGIRLAANTSPEPVTNIGLSLAEDVGAVGILALAIAFPQVAIVVVIVALIVIVALAIFLLGRIRRGWQALRRWLASSRNPA